MASWGSYVFELCRINANQGVDGRNRLELHFLESALPENSDWISCSGCENSRSSGKKPNFDPKPRKTRNDSSYQFS
ncbi:hypothetical protein L450_05211 [Klebsiella pneumoniae BIDMC 18C]|nr:hypothetical protein L450_05211 [Klebsiella pneumoniae BIDMC 18C]